MGWGVTAPRRTRVFPDYFGCRGLAVQGSRSNLSCVRQKCACVAYLFSTIFSSIAFSGSFVAWLVRTHGDETDGQVQEALRYNGLINTCPEHLLCRTKSITSKYQRTLRVNESAFLKIFVSGVKYGWVSSLQHRTLQTSTYHAPFRKFQIAAKPNKPIQRHEP